MQKRKSRRGNFVIEELEDISLSDEIDAKVSKLTALADSEIEQTRVNFRWQKEPLNLIKKVAESMGVPYQTYIKQVLYRQALNDIQLIQSQSVVKKSKPHPPAKHL
jgi:predicted DNA binding CopG/RHH family protein